MEKEVIVSVNGMQYTEDEQNQVSLISPGMYYHKNDKHYVTYEEAIDGGTMTVTNLLKISGSANEPKVEIIKKGGIGTHFIFEKGKNNITCYETEYGSFLLGLQASSIDVICQENEIDIQVEYALEMNYERVSDNRIEMNIKSKSHVGSLKLED